MTQEPDKSAPPTAIAAGGCATPPATATPPSATRVGIITLLWILALAAGVRAAILFTGQSWLRSDEAVVGLMAKHIVTKGERPLFLYGQSYGGGHAIDAYIAAPLFKWFGPSAIVLTAIPAILSLVNILLLWLITRRLFGERVAACAAILYAFAPPVIYQSFLVNGGTESFCLSLLALYLFVRGYYDGALTVRGGLLVGLFSGAAYYAMDYAALYPIAFTALLIAAPRPRRARYFGAMVVGFLIGCAPIIAYDFMTDFAHLRQMAGGGAGSVGFLGHVGGAFAGIFTGDLACFLGGEIDDFTATSWPMHLAAYALVIIVVALIWRNRRWFAESIRSIARRPMPGPELLPIFFILIYLAIYLVARFSLPELRTPRYFLPFSPFFAMAAAIVLTRDAKARLVPVGIAVIMLAAGFSVERALDVGMYAPTHEEHHVRTSGPAMDELAQFVREKKIHYAYAPYEIQWRLMFATDESVIVSSWAATATHQWPITTVVRYPAYDIEVNQEVSDGAPYAFIFRRDFAFAEWAQKNRLGVITRANFARACEAAGIDPQGARVGEEYVVYWPMKREFLDVLDVTLAQEYR